MVPRTSNPQLKMLLGLARVFAGFLLSGFIHGAASHMLPGDTKPLHEMLFFPLQAVGIIAQIVVLDRLVSRSIRPYFNVLFVCAWLYWTSPIMCDDQRAGGMWASPQLGTKMVA